MELEMNREQNEYRHNDNSNGDEKVLVDMTSYKIRQPMIMENN